MVTIAEDNRRKHLTILKALYSGKREEINAAQKAQQLFEEDEKNAFWAFQVDVGNLFVELKEELDQKLDDIADACPEETDPRKWTGADWAQFEIAIAGYEHEDILRTYAAGIENINLIWSVIEDRLDLP